MCMQDIQIGRSLTSRYLQVAVPLGGTVILPANPRRVAFTIASRGANLLVFRPQIDGNADINGMAINTQCPPVVVRIEDVGNMITQTWEAFSFVAGQTIGIIESELAAQSPEQLKK